MLVLECDEAIPAPDPAVVQVHSYATFPGCCCGGGDDDDDDGGSDFSDDDDDCDDDDDDGGSSAGGTCIDFKLLGLNRLPPVIEVRVKKGGSLLDMVVSTNGCGTATVLSTQHLVDKARPLGCSGVGICRIYKVNVDCPVLLSGRPGCERVIMKEDDFTDPHWTFQPPHKTVSCSEGIVFDMPTAADVCGVVTIEQLGPDAVLGSCPGEVTYVRRWKARDECFNYSGATEQRITVPAHCCPGAGEGLDEYSLEDQTNFAYSLVPNPAKETVQLSINGIENGEVTVAIFDLSGRAIYQNTLFDTTNPSLFFDTNTLGMETGLYLVKVEHAGETHIEKLFVQH